MCKFNFKGWGLSVSTALITKKELFPGVRYKMMMMMMMMQDKIYLRNDLPPPPEKMFLLFLMVNDLAILIRGFFSDC